MNEIIRAIEMEQLRTDIPDFAVGDTVRVQVKVVEGTRERLQAFEGTVILARRTSRLPLTRWARSSCRRPRTTSSPRSWASR